MSPAANARVALGMTLHNNAAHLPEALESILRQTCGDFVLVMVDDASSDETERIARGYASRDARLRYYRHDERQGMIPTWVEAVWLARRECPSATYFAWASDHDRWHPDWLARLQDELDRHPAAVLAYPWVQRMTPTGEALGEGEPRRFEATGTDARERWRRFCRTGRGAGDMVYGLMRLAAVMDAGVFRPVLRPDRLLVFELVLRGEIRQVPAVLWYRRTSAVASVARQRETLLLPDRQPDWFGWAPWRQHGRMLRREYSRAKLAALGLRAGEWRRMRWRYQAAFAWRHLRKSEASLVLGRGVDRLIHMRKLAKHYLLHAVFRTLVSLRRLRGHRTEGL